MANTIRKNKDSRARSAIGAGAVGSLPLVAALIAASVLPSGQGGGASNAAIKHAAVAVKCDSDFEDFNTCHTDYPTGCTKAGRYDADLNLLKNKLIRPTGDSATLLTEAGYKKLERDVPEDLSKGNRKQFAKKLKDLGEGDVREIVGYLYYAKLSGSESSNCQLTGEENVDFHIGIGFDDKLAKALLTSRKLSASQRKALTQTSVIVEMTPHYRGFFEPNWTIDAVKSNIGKRVKVLGQLIVDNEHIGEGQDCAFSSDPQDSCWRASVWELHPVTGFFVCNDPNSNCDDNSTDWVDVGKTQDETATANRSYKPKKNP